MTVVGSNLAPHTTLLKPFTGPKYPVLHFCSLTGVVKGYLWKQTWPSLATSLGFLDSIRVKVYVGIKWISVLVWFGLILTNTVTYIINYIEDIIIIYQQQIALLNVIYTAAELLLCVATLYWFDLIWFIILPPDNRLQPFFLAGGHTYTHTN